MNWRLGRESDNVEDERSSGGGGRGLMVGGGLGTLVIALIALLLGKNPATVLNNINGGSAASQSEQAAPGPNDERYLVGSD